MRHTCSILILLLVGLFTAPLPVARAKQPEPIERTLARIPSSAEVIVVMDGLTAARRLPATAALFDALNDLGFTENIEPRWAAVAALLGWGEAETLDRLMGSRVVLVASELDRKEDATWAILSEISPDTADRLRERIPTAPRKALVGLPIFALERGEIEMATLHLGADGAERVMLLLGPTRRAQLFDHMAAALSRGIPETLAGTPVVRELVGHASPGLLVAIRIDQTDAAEHHPRWRDFLICHAAPKGRAWECRVTVRDAGVAPQVRAIKPTSDAPFVAMSKGAMLAILESRLAAPGAEPSNPFERLLSLLSPPDSTENILTGRQAIAVWPRSTKESPDAPHLAAVPEPTSICCAFAMETSDIKKMAPVGDSHLGRLVAFLEQTYGGKGSPIPDFGGVSCHAVRSVPLELPGSPALIQLFNGPARIAWSYPAAGAPDTPSTTARPGWWQVCVTGDNDTSGAGAPESCDRGGGPCADASRRMVAALLHPDAGGEVAPWVSLGAVSPAQWAPIARMLLDAPDAEPKAADGIIRLIQRIQHVEWRLAARDNGDVAGTLRIEMSPKRK